MSSALNQSEPVVRRAEPGDIPSIRRDRVGVVRSLGDPQVGLFIRRS
ncbi:MAG TPA: hypothetical protein VK745_30540 [Polyangiaceae bacterium]|nr:hypothetical protein [Polyangiaceae bacterium]